MRELTFFHERQWRFALSLGYTQLTTQTQRADPEKEEGQKGPKPSRPSGLHVVKRPIPQRASGAS
jgi:hypothetical protein